MCIIPACWRTSVALPAGPQRPPALPSHSTRGCRTIARASRSTLSLLASHLTLRLHPAAMQTVSLSHSRLNTHFTTTARRVTSPCIAPARPQQRRGGRAAQQLLRARAEVQQAPAAAPAAQQSVDSDGEERVPPGCARYTVELPKPLGLVLEEGKSGRGVYVVSRRQAARWVPPPPPPPPPPPLRCRPACRPALDPAAGQQPLHCTPSLARAPWAQPQHRCPGPPWSPHPATPQAEVVPDSNAARLAPQIGVGDELVATTGMTYTTAQEYQGNTVRGGGRRPPARTRVCVCLCVWCCVVAVGGRVGCCSAASGACVPAAGDSPGLPPGRSALRQELLPPPAVALLPPAPRSPP